MTRYQIKPRGLFHSLSCGQQIDPVEYTHAYQRTASKRFMSLIVCPAYESFRNFIRDGYKSLKRYHQRSFLASVGRAFS